MNHVLTLVVNPAEATLDSALLSRLHDALDKAGISSGKPQWLAPETACDIPLDAAPDNAKAITETAVRRLFGETPVDFCLATTKNRRKRLLIADMDSTIIQVECIDELADVMGLRDRVAAITERAMRGELDFRAALRERAQMLAGLPIAEMKRVYETRVQLTPGARTLVRTMRVNGAHAVLVSGGFTFFTRRVADAAGFDHHVANVLEEQDNTLTGKVAEPIVGADTKLANLREACMALGLPLAAALAIGDGANDIPMIEAAGLGLAYHAKPRTAAAAQAHIAHTDLTTALFFQGYRQDEFASD